jgi:putative FmdB family regulatory protein
MGFMPIFEYKCAKCGHVMEVLQKSRAAETPTCAKCGGSELKKLLSGFAVGKTSAAPARDSCFDSPMCGGACPGGSCPMS